MISRLVAMGAAASLLAPQACLDRSDTPEPVAEVAGTATPLRFGTAELPTGVRLHYAEQGEPGAGPTVLLLHGYTDSWFSWSRVLPLLPPTWHVLALDQRGHGASSRPEGEYSPAAMARDAIAFLEARGIARAVVVGHSMGSFVAQQVALADPGRVQALVLVASATLPRSFPGVEEMRQAIATFDTVPAPFVREFQESTVHAPVPAEFMDAVVEASLQVPGSVWRAAMDGMIATEVPTGLAGGQIPTLIQWGAHDGIFGREQQDALLALIPGSRLVAYPDLGHAPHWEDPARFVEDLRGWILEEG